MNLYMMFQREVAEKVAIYKDTIKPCISNNGFSRELLTSIITLYVKDLDKSMNFYEQELGWKKIKAGNSPTGVFKLNGMVLRLCLPQLLVDEVGLHVEEKSFSGIVLSYTVYNEQEVDAIFKQLKQTSARIIRYPVWSSFEEYGGYFADPDGHTWHVVYNLYYPAEKAQQFRIS